MRHPSAKVFWPEPPFEVALVEPEIPPNTGNIARLCAATGSVLHLVGPLGFRLDNRALKRAGLDYWDKARIRRYGDWAEFEPVVCGSHHFMFSTKGTRPYWEARYQPGHLLIFGSETRGLSEDLLKMHAERVLTVPMKEGARSLNLSNAVAIVLYEAIRQVATRGKMGI